MNGYGTRLRERWRQWMPERLAALPDPTAFFTQLGIEVEVDVTELAIHLAGPDPEDETYLQKMRRLMGAHSQAMEVVLNSLVWIPEPALPLPEAREEWEQTRPSDENLIVWAERMQDHPDSMPSTEELEQFAESWAVSIEFLQGLVATEPPRAYLVAHQAEMAEAATIRFLRELS